jgi:hypothetical protein
MGGQVIPATRLSSNTNQTRSNSLLSNEATSGVRNGFNDAAKEYGAEPDRKHSAGGAVRSLRLRRRKPREPMAQKGGNCRLQQGRPFWVCKFG